MSAIRVLRTRRENTVQQRDATLPGGDFGSRPGAHLDQNVLGQLRRGNLSLDSEPLGRPLFRCPQGPRSEPAPLFGANVALENPD